QRGKDYLAKHKPENALKSFKKALETCPVQHGKDLSKVLFYLGVTLNKLGMPDIALKSWVASLKIVKTSYSGKMLKRFSNEYGMARQENEEQNDWAAFYSIQLAKYLRSKRTGKIGTIAEKDMIRDLIFDYWKDLKTGGSLDAKSSEEKIEIFQRFEIVFPFIIIPNHIQSRNFVNDPIAVNFNHKKRVSPGSRCFCGSGLMYNLCCGRTPGEDELLNGVF
ncbi:MAG: hypothetical protein AB1798_20605, partial [Spirochaetota bacterium]